MAEYIERDEAIKVVNTMKRPNKYLTIQYLQELKAADVAPVRRGKWDRQLYHRRLMYCCSLCGSRRSGKTNFCPNCGAKMDWRE